MPARTSWTSRLPLRCCELTSTNHGRPQAQRTLRPQLPQLDERGGVRVISRVPQPPQLVRGGLSIGRRLSRCHRWTARWGSSACSSASFCSATSTPARSPSSTPASHRLGRTAHWPARSRRCCSRHAPAHARTHAPAHARTHACTDACTCATHMPCARQSYGRRHPCGCDANGPRASAAGGGACGDHCRAAGRHPRARAAAGEAPRAPSPSSLQSVTTCTQPCAQPAPCNRAYSACDHVCHRCASQSSRPPTSASSRPSPEPGQRGCAAMRYPALKCSDASKTDRF